MGILLTKSDMFIVKYFADILGVLMDWIFKIGITNIGLAIIVFSIVVYMVMMPMQIKQQKFSKMNSIMSPELQKIQKKYEGKKDNESMLKMNEETKAVYAKYGVSPSGSCLQLLIQMPILFALYQVIWRIPGYVTGIKETFTGVLDKITNVEGYTAVLNQFITDNNINAARIYWDTNAEVIANDSIIDLLYSLSPTEWTKFADISEFAGFTDIISSTAAKIQDMQYFLVYNIADTPWEVMQESFFAGNYMMIFFAVLIPFLAWGTQVLSTKVLQAGQPKMEGNMGSTMKAMNVYMPLMSAFFCLTLPIGLGIYWIIGAVIRTLQTMGINRYMKNMDVDDLIKKNLEKVNKKRAKQGLPPQKITQQANQNVKKIQNTEKKKTSNNTSAKKVENKPTNYKPGSLASKANMVARYDYDNSKKNK